MQIDIKTTGITPLRQTFGHVARRLGPNKTASRYQEATFDLQPEINFHYRPLWEPDKEIYDRSRTAVAMEDWYSIKDPRQFYYGTWTITRSKQQDSTDRNFKFVEERNLLSVIEPEWQQRIKRVILPLRHLEYAANLNNCYMTAYGYGTAITQATMFSTIDRLGVAQYITRVGLVLDGNTAESLDEAKVLWMEAPEWQPIREMAENMLVTEDWFELFVAQNLVLDGLLYPLVYNRFDSQVAQHGGSAFAMLTEFQTEWFTENNRFVDAAIKTVAAESEQNAELIRGWIKTSMDTVLTAVKPLMVEAFGGDAEAQAQMDSASEEFAVRLLKKCKLEI